MLLGNILLALAWTALQGELTLTNLVVGYVLGYGVLRLLAHGGVIPRRYLGKVGSFLRLAAYLVYELAYANVRLTLDVLHPSHRIRPGVIAVPLDAKSDGEILMLATLVNFTPGSTAIDVSEDRKIMYIHMMHIAESPDASRREIKDGFERRIIQLFEPMEDPATDA
jgi:multicomponent Na+:H+ antiporter subunit E